MGLRGLRDKSLPPPPSWAPLPNPSFPSLCPGVPGTPGGLPAPLAPARVLFVLCGIILSVFGWMGPIAAAMLHTLSTLIIIFNSARLLRASEEATSVANNLNSWRRNLQLETAKE